MESTLTIEIAAPPETVFALVANVDRWPCILPHYRWVRRLAVPGAVEMAARRSFWPVRWHAIVEPRAAERRVHFRHIGGPTTGMEVEWRLLPHNGGTRVMLWHSFRSRLPLIAPCYEWVVQHVFIEHIAGRTMRCIKREAEAQAALAPPRAAPPRGEVHR